MHLVRCNIYLYISKIYFRLKVLLNVVNYPYRALFTFIPSTNVSVRHICFSLVL